MQNINPATPEKLIAIKNEIVSDNKKVTFNLPDNERDYHKFMIITSNTTEANKYIETELGIHSFKGKISALKKLFPDISVVSSSDTPNISKEESLEMDYWALLNTVLLNGKV